MVNLLILIVLTVASLLFYAFSVKDPPREIARITYGVALFFLLLVLVVPHRLASLW